jgi:hypothetical protein
LDAEILKFGGFGSIGTIDYEAGSGKIGTRQLRGRIRQGIGTRQLRGSIRQGKIETRQLRGRIRPEK